MLSRTLAVPVLTLAVLVSFAVTPPAAAQPPAGDCMVGPGLAATLLVPYFEVDLADPNGLTTLISLNNGLAGDALARVVLWTDWGIPTLAFDVFLEGFDVQTINLRSVFNGNVPSTGTFADLSAFEGCDVEPPSHANPALSAVERQQLAADHTGEEGPLFSDCAGEFYGASNTIARGYVTVDVVDECNGIEANDPEVTPANDTLPYFVDGGGAGGVATTDNRLWGDVIYVDFDGNAAQGSEAIGIWADPAQFTGTGTFTFYGRYSGWDGRDDRVPLADRWNQRFLNGGAFAGGAELIVWRDTGSAAIAPQPCDGSRPVWWPLPDDSVALDEDAGDLVDLGSGNFPLATQRVNVDGLGIPYDFGWIQVDTEDLPAWVQPTLTAGGRFSANFNGTPVTFLCDEVPPSVLSTTPPAKRARRSASGS